MEGALDWASPRAAAAVVLLTAIFAAALLAWPMQTVSAKYLNDLFIFLDGAYRLCAGQVPHRDFHTPMGPLVTMLPAAGLLLTGSLGAAMPVGVGLLILLLAPVMAHVLSSRLRPVLAIPMGLYLALILAAPANLGEDAGLISFAMFYNRIGWATLSLLLIMVLRPTVQASDLRDALSAALLTLVMLYIKASYGVVALAFLAASLLERNQRRWAAGALAATLAVTLLLEAAWRLPSRYVLDLAQAAHASGAVQGGFERLLVSFGENRFDYAAFLAVAVMAVLILRDVRLVLFLGYCAGAGLLILNQNFQISGIVTLAAGSAVVAEALARRHATAERPLARYAPAAACGLLLVLVIPMILDRAVAHGSHAVFASTRPAHRFPLPRLDRIVLIDGSSYDATFTATYLTTLADGAQALSAGSPSDPVVVLDFVNPFSVGLGRPAPRGDYGVSQFDRTFNMTHLLPAEITLREAQIVMVPKWPLDTQSVGAFLALYEPYLSANFQSAPETEFWRIYARRDPMPEIEVGARGSSVVQ
jgi:hypothetical protein